MKLILNQPSGSMRIARSFVEFDERGGTLGAAADNTLVLPAGDGSVSPRQAHIVRTRSHWSIRNEGERFIVINGRWLESGAERVLADDDVIEIGVHLLIVEHAGAPNEPSDCGARLPDVNSQDSPSPLRAYPSDDPDAFPSPIGDRFSLGLGPSVLLNTPVDPLSLFSDSGYDPRSSMLDLFEFSRVDSTVNPSTSLTKPEAARFRADADGSPLLVKNTMLEIDTSLQARLTHSVWEPTPPDIASREARVNLLAADSENDEAPLSSSSLADRHRDLARAFLEGAGEDINAQISYTAEFMYRLGALVRIMHDLRT